MDDAELKVAIVGAGSVGLALGSCLHGSGHRLTFVGKGDSGRGHAGKGHAASDETLRLLIGQGLRRTGIFGETFVPPESITVREGIECLADEPHDLVLVCTKTTSTQEIASELGEIWPRLLREPRVVICQNGWGNAERFAAELPREQIDNARIITGFRRAAMNHVEVTVHADAIHLGCLFGPPSRLLGRLATAIAKGGIPCTVAPDIGADLWAKLLYNCLLNPLSALMDVPYGVLGEGEATRSVMAGVAREIFGVLEASGHRTHWRNVDEYLEAFYGDLLPPTAEHESSMLQDLRSGRQTEIDALCGAVVRLGQSHDVDTPINRSLFDLVVAAESRRRRDSQVGA